MLIINADDWGRSVVETDAALRCCKAGRVTSVSTMVFMEDSERAADLARQNKVGAGLHLNFDESFTAKRASRVLGEYQAKLARFLRRHRYAQLIYNPFLRQAFFYSYQAQADEFLRLFGKPPSHIDGHHHMHLAANLLFSNMIPAGRKMRRNFSFWPREKSLLNRVYRGLVDRWLARKYRLPDYFFDLTQCTQGKKMGRVATLAKSSNVELMTHPVARAEAEYLMSDEFQALLRGLELRSYELA
jgi:chitin disaccharide deacetylase